MKKVFAVLFLIASLLIVPVALAEEKQDDAVLKAFQPILKKYIEFFKTNPKMLAKTAPPNNPGLISYAIHHFVLRQAYYDLVRTNSIVTPYSGFIDVTTDVLDNKPCGTVPPKAKDKEGWADINEAIKTADNNACFISRTVQTGPLIHRFHFDYDYLSSRWNLSKITYGDGNLNGRFMVLLNVASPYFPVMNEPEALEFNKPWIELLRGSGNTSPDAKE